MLSYHGSPPIILNNQHGQCEWNEHVLHIEHTRRTIADARFNCGRSKSIETGTPNNNNNNNYNRIESEIAHWWIELRFTVQQINRIIEREFVLTEYFTIPATSRSQYRCNFGLRRELMIAGTTLMLCMLMAIAVVIVVGEWRLLHDCVIFWSTQYRPTFGQVNRFGYRLCKSRNKELENQENNFSSFFISFILIVVERTVIW